MCHLRLDFESFDTNGLSGSGENNAGTTDTTLFACQDQFTIAVFFQNMYLVTGSLYSVINKVYLPRSTYVTHK